jgi:Tfp pilus assembly protein PilO
MIFSIKLDSLSIGFNRVFCLLCLFVALIVSASVEAGAAQQGPKTKKQPKNAPKSDTKQQELKDITSEISSLLRRIPAEEEDLQQAIGNIKSELRLRELRWRLFERGTAVEDAPFIYHPVRIDLLCTYERLTDALLNLAAFNYLVIVDNLEIRRAKQQAPLVSIEASLTIWLYSLGGKERAQLEAISGDTVEAKLELARHNLSLLESRFEERVACWSALRAIGKNFPKSTETVLTEMSFEGDLLKFAGLSRSATIADQIGAKLSETNLFNDLSKEQAGPSFTVQATLTVKKAYQQWLEGIDNSDFESIARDPFTTSYSVAQLTQGSGGSANYPPLEKRLEDYLKQVNEGSRKRPDRIAPYLVAELSLAGLYLTPNIQGGIFKTPNQKEIYISIGASCYNGRFTGIQQGRALFEEVITGSDGRVQSTQVVKIIESNCISSPALQVGKPSDELTRLEQTARAKLPAQTLTLNATNIELHSLLPLLHELSGGAFGFVLDQSVPRLCVSMSRERAPFGDLLLAILHSVNLALIEEGGVFRILPQDRAGEAQSPALATSLDSPPISGKFGSADYSAEPVTLSITEVELGDVVKFFGGKYGVVFALSAEAESVRVTASIAGLEWTRALAAVLRSARMGVLVESGRSIILSRADLLAAQSQGKAKIEQ